MSLCDYLTILEKKTSFFLLESRKKTVGNKMHVGSCFNLYSWEQFFIFYFLMETCIFIDQ